MPSQHLHSWEEIGNRVASARQAAGFTQEQLADRIGVHRSALTRVEQGTRQLDALELVRLAEALGRELSWFVTPPPTAIASHRREGHSDDAAVRRLEDELEAIARDVQLLLEIGELPQAPALPDDVSLDTFEEAETAAQQARDLLGLGAQPAVGIQEQAENLGLYIFSLDLGPSVIDGGYVRVGGTGAALVNGASDAGRRRFSAAHELGHHFAADEYTTDFAVGQAVEDRERLINAFAIHFLMPRGSLLSRWSELRSEGRRDPRIQLIILAAEYRVSWSAACTHARTLGLIDRSELERLLTQPPGTIDYIDLGVEFDTELDPVVLPPAFSRAVLRAYRRHRIGRARAVSLLRGTVREDELPEPDDLPMDALRDEFTAL